MKKCQLNVKDSRITLSSALTPRFGYELETGVACTFTLDFETVLGVFYSLGMKDEIQTQTPGNSKLQLMRGIQKYSDKLSFYCNDCSVSVPRNQKVFTGLMDKCIFEVNPTKASFPHSGIFHPKIWILLYTPTTNNENAQPYIKIIISSRNLSKSSNLDYAIALEAPVKDQATQKTLDHAKPLTDWLDYLAQFTPEEKKRAIATLKEYVSRSDDALLDSNGVYSGYWFLPLGISEEYDKDSIDLLNEEFNKKFKKEWLIVVSPFLGEDFIKNLTDDGTTPEKSALLTRRSSLTKSIWESFTNVYGLKSILNNDELIEESSQSESNANEAVPYRDLHAKMYFYRSDKQNMLLTGSANATRQAFNNNVEFMLQLELPNTARSVTYESLCEELFQLNEDGELTPNSPFEEIEFNEDDAADSETEESKYKIVDRRELCEKILGAEVLPDGDRYTVVIKTDGSVKEEVTIAPLNAKDSAVPLTAETRIAGLSLNQLSNFYIITTPDDKFIKIIETQNMPVAERNKAIFNTIIENKTDFYKMVELILADLPASVVSQWEMNALDNSNGSLDGKNAYIPKGIYERALEVAVSNNEPFKELKSLFDSLSADKIDSQLVKMLETFNQALRKIENKQ